MIAVNSQTRIAFDNILFATDLSPAAEAAVPYVVETARAFGSMVHAVHVKTADWNILQEKEIGRLDERLGDVPQEVMIETGDVRATLLHLAARKGINLIVLGTHGRTGLGRVILGSVAEAIFRQAPCPVLTVGPGLCADSTAFLTNETLYATDLTPASAAATRYALGLARRNYGRLSILTVLPKPVLNDAAESERQVTLALHRLEGLVPAETQLPCPPYFMAEQGEPAEKILEAASTYDAGLIVLGIRPHSIGMATHVSRRTAHEVVARASCPVLTVPCFGPSVDFEISPDKIEEFIEVPEEPIYV